MILKAITELTSEIFEEYQEVEKNLMNRFAVNNFYSLRSLFEKYKSNRTGSRELHSGKLKEGVNLTELELSMICDGGFSHFGGSSTIELNGEFFVTIYID